MKAGNISCVIVTLPSCQRETNGVFFVHLDMDANGQLQAGSIHELMDTSKHSSI